MSDAFVNVDPPEDVVIIPVRRRRRRHSHDVIILPSSSSSLSRRRRQPQPCCSSWSLLRWWWWCWPLLRQRRWWWWWWWSLLFAVVLPVRREWMVMDLLRLHPSSPSTSHHSGWFVESFTIPCTIVTVVTVSTTRTPRRLDTPVSLLLPPPPPPQDISLPLPQHLQQQQQQQRRRRRRRHRVQSALFSSSGDSDALFKVEADEEERTSLPPPPPPSSFSSSPPHSPRTSSSTILTSETSSSSTSSSSSQSVFTVPFLTPYQILYPDSFPFQIPFPSSSLSASSSSSSSYSNHTNTNTNTNNSNNNTTTTNVTVHLNKNGYDRTLTLHNTIRLFQQALQEIIAQTTTTTTTMSSSSSSYSSSSHNHHHHIEENPVKRLLHRATTRPYDITTTTTQHHDHDHHDDHDDPHAEERIIRIEHQLSAPTQIDPLIWLRRQVQRKVHISTTSSTHSQNDDATTSTTTTLPLFYLRSNNHHPSHPHPYLSRLLSMDTSSSSSSESVSSSPSSSSSSSSSVPIIMEETTEVATIGAVRIVHNTDELLQRYYNSDPNQYSPRHAMHHTNATTTNNIRNATNHNNNTIIPVPTNTRWYGGARFDPNYNRRRGASTSMHPDTDNNNNDDDDDSNDVANQNDDQDWSDFDTTTTIRPTNTTTTTTTTSSAYWILPAIELLVTQRVNLPNQEDHHHHPYSTGLTTTTTTTATLAIHLVATKETNYDWTLAARKVLHILNAINDECVSAIPSTTLPPILERGNYYTTNHPKQQQPNSNYNKNNNQRNNHNMDDDNNDEKIEYRKDHQEFYEEAVAQALKKLQPLTLSTQLSRLDELSNETSINNDNVNNNNYDDNNCDKNKSTASDSKTSVKTTFSTPPPPQQHDGLEKVVLARKQCLHFGTTFTALDVLRRWKYGGHEGGHLFYLRPGQIIDSCHTNIVGSDHHYKHSEFFGCTPERLFSVRDGPSEGWVQSEALAGTRPRGSTQYEDDLLLHELLDSPKDRRENRLTGLYIEQAFHELHDAGLVAKWNENHTTHDIVSTTSDDPSLRVLDTEKSLRVVDTANSGYFVRRLLHLQHLCQRYSAKIYHSDQAMVITRTLLQRLHPTPAVCGVPMKRAMEFIRQYESVAFDRGYYSGPIGYIGQRETDILVALRCGLATTNNHGTTTLATYAGAGLVHGSTLQGEWAETNYKFAVVSSLFPQSPTTLRGSPTANVAWSTAFVSELIRNGITRFYICPGSRSTPLVAAIAKAVRSNVGVVHAISVHDERAAGFRAVGYVRGTGNLCAVLTSSGTAVANLYPAIVEAGMDGLPLLLLTADRPYESRAIGANQAIDQVKTFSDSYIRWFRDILPPSDEVPVSIALSDACHAIHLARELRGPVHINIQFRENLAPDAGPIRGDSRVNSLTKFNGMRFTDVPGFDRWSSMGDVWSKSYARSNKLGSPDAIQDVANLIAQSKRGIIVVGNIRSSANGHDEQGTVEEAISDFAKAIGFPIFAGVQNANLRFKSSAVVVFAEHLLKCQTVAENLQPDFVIQIGTPLLSTAIPDVLVKASKKTMSLPYVLLHPHSPQERSDPSMIVTHSVQAEILPFLNSIMDHLSSKGLITKCSSQLAAMVPLGRILQAEMKHIIFEASSFQHVNETSLTEPQIVVALSELFAQGRSDRSLFLSNSMPIRDAEMFFYPYHDSIYDAMPTGHISVGSNRGASGIDGIISTALGYSESTAAPTTLLIGDMATLHDIGSFHSVANSALQQSHHTVKKRNALATIIINNDGGGIFSFLPIAKHGNEVGFDEFFGVPTNSFSFSKGADAFGLPFLVVNTYESFYKAHEAIIHPSNNNDTIIEARVVGRNENVKVHQSITSKVEVFLSEVLSGLETHIVSNHLPVKIYGRGVRGTTNLGKRKTMVLLHGWMGDKLEWHETAKCLEDMLSKEWTIYSVDLPGHGASTQMHSSQRQVIQASLRLSETNTSELPLKEFTIDSMAESVLRTLETDCSVNKIDTLVGYSLGGRISLAMQRLCASKGHDDPESIMSDTTVILLGAHPGNLVNNGSSLTSANAQRIQNDEMMAAEIVCLADKACLQSSVVGATLLMSGFLKRWYRNPIWTGLSQRDGVYHEMISKRSSNLLRRGRDIAFVLSSCSPPKSEQEDWKYCSMEKTLFIAGEQDVKYKSIGQMMHKMLLAQYQEVAQSSHALLVEAPVQVADAIATYLLQNGTLSVKKNSLIEAPKPTKSRLKIVEAANSTPLWATSVDGITAVGALEYERFEIKILDDDSRSPILGSGWGRNSVPDASDRMVKRQGFIVQIACSNSLMNGLGEISPLKGLHNETIDDVHFQLAALHNALKQATVDNLPYFEANRILSLNGSLGIAIERLAELAKVDRFFPSVRSGLEMALISLAAQQGSFPIHQALAIYATKDIDKASSNMVSLSGFISRKLPTPWTSTKSAPFQRSFKSIKIKVGHQDLELDKLCLLQGFQKMERQLTGRNDGRIRADANRAWNESQVIAFATLLEGLDVHAIEKIEYIEEPLQKVQKSIMSPSGWTLGAQVAALERSFLQTNLQYAIDESLADVVMMCDGKFDDIKDVLKAVFENGPRGCAALVLKPSLLGYELAFQIAQFSRTELGIAAVFSSSFDSGLGLAHTAFLSNIVDKKGNAEIYPHGLGTFTILESDTITPSFESYVNNEGILNVPSLSRALFGLSLEEMRDSAAFPRDDSQQQALPTLLIEDEYRYEASTATSVSGKEISVAVSLPLPFSADTAWVRFTDLPSMSRWSPWITSVRYEGLEETEWVINVRGIPLKWRATSQLIYEPFKGIQWQSVSGLRNSGVVEFIPNVTGSMTSSSCVMNVRMTITPPRLFRPFLPQGSLFLEDFLRDRLLKWSLEMFRDVVKADLALERGDVELGDALISSVEGKANAIEAALLSTSLSQTAPISAPSSTTFSEDSRDGDIFE